ncbi:acyl-CoA carboxylase subunit epsilon [Mycobacterium sp. SM1]|nr:acyl-CoA carboxylase subunit epsilon [Mycobacterium sp. SM1]
MSDGNETNKPAPTEFHDLREPHIQILKGQPTDEELAALIVVLGRTGGGTATPGPVERNMWGHPVDKLRYPIFSWQRVTLLERIHMRR